MFRFISSASAMLILVSAFSMPVWAGDCSKTVMGGGCAADTGAGVAPHMRQIPAEPSKQNSNASTSAKGAQPNTVKVSTAAQKPKI